MATNTREISYFRMDAVFGFVFRGSLLELVSLKGVGRDTVFFPPGIPVGTRHEERKVHLSSKRGAAPLGASGRPRHDAPRLPRRQWRPRRLDECTSSQKLVRETNACSSPRRHTHVRDLHRVYKGERGPLLCRLRSAGTKENPEF